MHFEHKQVQLTIFPRRNEKKIEVRVDGAEQELDSLGRLTIKSASGQQIAVLKCSPRLRDVCNLESSKYGLFATLEEHSATVEVNLSQFFHM